MADDDEDVGVDYTMTMMVIVIVAIVVMFVVVVVAQYRTFGGYCYLPHTKTTGFYITIASFILVFLSFCYDETFYVALFIFCIYLHFCRASGIKVM